MTESQHLGSIILTSKTPLLFICRIAMVTSVESSSREEKRRPYIGSLNFGNKSESGGLMPGLGRMRYHFPPIIAKFFWLEFRDLQENIIMENEWSSHEQLRSVLVHFLARILHESTIMHSTDTSSKSHDTKQRSSFA